MEKLQEIKIPKNCQQPRTKFHGPRPRSQHLSGYTFENSSFKNSCSSITTATEDLGCQDSVSNLEDEKPRMSWDVAKMSSAKCKALTSVKVESVAQSPPLETSDSWTDTGCTIDRISMLSSIKELPSTPTKSASQADEECCNVSIVPGCVVWAKTSHRTWWPAEVMDEKTSTKEGNVGRVLVQFYGNHDYAWLDPVGDLSHFEDCFEERCCNHTELFQDALNQALHRKQHLNTFKLLDKSPVILANSNHKDQSSGLSQNICYIPDKWNSSSSSTVGDDYHDEGRGKRIRKPKIRFEEKLVPIKSKKKSRRLRIMRYLGLVAPSGSPFTLASHL